MNEAPKVTGNNTLPQGTNSVSAGAAKGGGNPKADAISQGVNQGSQILDGVTDKLAGDDGKNTPQLGEQVVNKEPQTDENGNQVEGESEYKPGDKVAPGYEVGEDGKVKQSATSRLQSAVAGGAAAYLSGGDANAAKAAKDLSDSKTGRRISDALEKNAAVKKTAEIAEDAGVLDATEGAIDGVVAAKNLDVQGVIENAKKIKKGSKKLKKKTFKIALIAALPMLLPAIFFAFLLLTVTIAFGDENTTSSGQIYENTYNYEWTGEDDEGGDNERDDDDDEDGGDNGNGDIGTDVILLNIPYYNQGNYKNKKFGGKNIATSGCSVTSLAMVLQFLTGKTITPPDVVDKIAEVKGNYNYYYTGEKGQKWTIMTEVPTFYGISARQISLASVKNALAEGKPVIASVNCCTFTKRGHFIVIKGYDPVKGEYYVNDPNHSNFKSTPFAESIFKNEAKAYWSFG